MRNHLILGAVGAIFLTASALAVTGGRGISQQGTFLQSGTGATLRTLESNLRDRVSVCDWIGQTCPSGGDDTLAFQAAVTAAATAKAALLIPKGDYSLTAQITVPTNSHIMGTGIESHVYWTGNAINAGFAANSTTDVTIEGLYIEGKTTPTNALTRCIEAESVTRLRVLNNKFTGCGAANRGSGYRASVDVGGSDIWIERNYFSGNGLGTAGNDSHTINTAPTPDPATPTIVTNRIFIRDNHITGNTDNLAIAILDARDVEVSRNYVDENNTKTINNSGYGIMVYNTANAPTSGNAPARIRVEGNFVTNTAGYGIYLQGVTDAAVAGNVLKDTAKQQTEVDLGPAAIGLNQSGFPGGTIGGVTIVGNEMDTSAQSGISCAGCVGETISGNIVESAALNGIDIRTTSTDTEVVGNTVIGTQAAGSTGIIVRTSSTRVTVSNNAVKNLENGINLNAVNDNLAVDNRVNGSSANGIQASSTSARNFIARNSVTNSTGFGVAEGSATNYYIDNTLIGNTGGSANLNAGSTSSGNIVASGGLPSKTDSRVVLTYSATIATDASAGNAFSITATNGTAFTISNPTNLRTGQRLLYTIRNTSGGAHGAITWGATFKTAAAALTVTTAFSKSIEFIYDGTNLVEIFRSAADVAN